VVRVEDIVHDRVGQVLQQTTNDQLQIESDIFSMKLEVQNVPSSYAYDGMQVSASCMEDYMVH
jgi:hypothetical protein